MTRGKTRILGAVIMLATFIFASTFFMSKPKAAAAEEFPSANLENVTVHNVAHEDDSAVPPVYKENKTETIETKAPANIPTTPLHPSTNPTMIGDKMPSAAGAMIS